MISEGVGNLLLNPDLTPRTESHVCPVQCHPLQLTLVQIEVIQLFSYQLATLMRGDLVLPLFVCVCVCVCVHVYDNFQLVGSLQTTIFIQALSNFTCKLPIFVTRNPIDFRLWGSEVKVTSLTLSIVCGCFTDHGFNPIFIKLNIYVAFGKKMKPIDVQVMVSEVEVQNEGMSHFAEPLLHLNM